MSRVAKKSSRVETVSPQPIKRIIAYTRVSRGDKQRLSPEVQREGLQRWTLEHGAELVELFAESLSGDPGELHTALQPDGSAVSSLNLARRPALYKAVKRCREGNVDALVAVRRDRFFRGGNEAMAILSRLIAPARLITTDIDIEAMGLSGGLLADISDAAARHELVLIKDRTHTVMKSRHAGGFCVGAVPYGWRDPQGSIDRRLRAKNRILERDEDEQRVIKKIMRKRRNNLGYRTIAQQLDSENEPTRTGEPWHPQAVKRIVVRQEEAAKSS